MEPEEDAFGNILYDIYTGDNSDATGIIERDDGFIEPAQMTQAYFTEYEEWSQQVQQSIEHAHGSVLDIGCGAGRHSLHFQEEGFDVRGIDISPKAIWVAEERGLNKTSNVGIDSVEDLPESFDTFVLLGNNLGLLGTKPIERLRLLAEASSDSATLIGQTREATTTDTLHHTQYHEYNKARGRRPGCLRLRVRYQLYQGPWHNYLFINKEPLKDIINKTPWVLDKIYQGDESDYTVILQKD